MTQIDSNVVQRGRRLRGLVAVGALMTGIVPIAAQAGTVSAVGENVFISEFHYDNTGADTGEFVEVTGDAGTNLMDWSIVLYNGSNGTVYDSIDLSGVIADQAGGLGTASVDAPEMQNGAPDGLALVDDGGNVVEFLSYEGSFTAVGGAAGGMISTDVGVIEASDTPVGESLQLINGGWVGPMAESPGDLNVAPPANVVISEVHYDNAGADTGEFVEVQGDAGADLTGWSIVLYNGSNGAVYDTINLSGTIPDEAGGQGALAFGPTSSIQNGSPDGLALVAPGDVVIEFLSYEGSFTAVGGAAGGMISTDIGVIEASDTPVGESLQLINGGWIGPMAESPGDLNVAPPANVVISEIHYDNAGADTGEFVEVQGDAGADLTGWSIVLYNGSNGAVYDTINLSGTIDDEAGGQGALSFIPPGGSIQNGGPDGLALVAPGDVVIEFLSYEGSFAGVGGPADGVTSTDIGVSEQSGTPVGESLQLINGTWTGPAAESPGDLNAPPVPTVFISEIHYDNAGVDTGEFVEVQGDAGADLTGWSIVLYNGNGGAVYDTIALGGTIADQAGGQGVQVGFHTDIQNGSPDGLALVAPGDVVIEFLSYEGSFTAVGGAADGVTSTDIGVSETTTTPVGQSVQLLNGVWVGPADESPGLINTAPVMEVKIHEIQGTGSDSPLVGQTVTIEGIVVGDFQQIMTDDPTDEPLDGFMVQEEDADADTDPLTSEGVFVFAPGGTDVAVGDLVQVTGSVVEFFGLTEINNTTAITVVSSNNIPLPTPAAPTVPTAVGDPVVDWEAIEGMRVSFSQTLSVTNTFRLGQYGEVQLSAIGPQDHPNQTQAVGSQASIDQRQLNLDSRVTLDDGEDETETFGGISTWNPTPTPYLQQPEGTLRAGDEVTGLSGVVHFSFGEFEVQPVNTTDPLDPDGAVSFTRVIPRPGVPDVGGDLTVASFNVLNYFTTIDTGGALCGPPGNQQGCRGADSAQEFEDQAAKIVDALVDLDADIVGLIEIENNNDVAVADLVARVNADPEVTTTYDYIATGYFGTDAITVALMYDTAAVTPSGAFAALDSGVSPAYIDTSNRVALAQTFEDLATGEMLTVAVNHLKSKGSACTGVDNPGDPAFGVAPYGPGTDVDDPNFQGNCNLTRTAAAKVLGQWMASDPTGSGSDNLLILGDLNAYANEDPITELEGQGYTDLEEFFSGSNSWADQAHSYVFDGEHGTLDYGMANPALLAQITGAKAWHINADEPTAIDFEDFNPPGQYTADEFRSSDHDPIVIGLSFVPPGPTCNGLEPTITGSGFILGTHGDDVIIGSDNADVIFGKGGNDTICAGAGGDVVFAGWGNDTVFGEDGRDVVYGSAGNDIVDGGADNDVIFGSSGADEINGGSGNDRAYGGNGNDTLNGDDGNDRLYGNRGNDALDGGADTDYANGGSGNADSCVNAETSVNCEL